MKPPRKLAALLLCFAMMPAALATPQEAACPQPGKWFGPVDGRLSVDTLFSDLSERSIVMLGESHDRLEHHRWQLHVLAGLHARRPDMVIGLEMLPREAQPVLDAWVAGKLDERGFLEQSNWRQAWGHDPDLYFPILHFARMHRVPLRAINVGHGLRQRLTSEGWDAVPIEERHGMSPPAEPSEDYRQQLRSVFEQHPTATSRAGLKRFIAGQLVWDRAMAIGLAEAAADGHLVVGLIGQGHLRHGYGVPHQLEDLGIGDGRVLLPWERDDDCSPPPEGIAHAVFGIAGNGLYEPAEPQLLGIFIERDEEGVRIVGVSSDSIAEQAGLQEDDVITQAAGQPVRQPADLIAVVRRQAPGTLLPLEVLREGSRDEVLASFPAERP